MKLSVVMASMNEAKCIGQMIGEIRKYAPLDTEIVVVDSSSDETPKIAAEMGAKVLSRPAQGHGMALKFGLHQAAGDVIITSDCDMTYPMEKIPEMMEMIEKEHYDLVSGCRLTPELAKEMDFANKYANMAFALIVRVLYGMSVHDVSTGMFAMTRDYARTDWKGNFSMPAEIIMRSKLLKKKYKEIPIPYRIRVGETTLHKWRSGKAYLRSFFYWRFGWFANGEL